MREIIKEIAKELDLDPALIWAVMRVESNGHFSLKDGKIPILLERHWVYKFVKKRLGWRKARYFYKKYPDICNPKAGGYNKPSWYKDTQNNWQYEKLAKCIIKIDREIAHLSTSFGAFQIMGFNYALCGYESATKMANKFHQDPQKEQIKAFINFIKNYKHGKAYFALKNYRFDLFAKYYNGLGYKKNNYDNKLVVAYASWYEDAENIA